jgi:CheY-like chemotaxis protein
VFWLDPSDAAAFVLSRLLRNAGHDVRIAGSGEEALRTALSFQPEIVLLDLWMPKTDGYEIARRLRELRTSSRMRIIALSRVDPDAAFDLASGIDCHLAKPTPFIDILDAMNAEQPGELPVHVQLHKE